jgi:hypothetical protein
MEKPILVSISLCDPKNTGVYGIKVGKGDGAEVVDMGAYEALGHYLVAVSKSADGG